MPSAACSTKPFAACSSAQVYDVIHTTRLHIAQAGVQHVDDVRACGQRLVRFSDAMQTQSQALKHFLFHHLYRHEQVMRTMDAARQMVRELFDAYMAQPSMMKPRFAWRAQQAASPAAASTCGRQIFVAGMTDRYAAKEHARITGQQLLPAGDELRSLRWRKRQSHRGLQPSHGMARIRGHNTRGGMVPPFVFKGDT